uniref:GNAT family acetyltransferase n=1 Tax=uncultured marine crenarchaeote E37-7F TaxID=907717 RepID=G9BAR2_9ARCH|nr:GNAT family acetyltransferase [uncultured marine crenarchaeote E37-7F]
MRIRKFKQEDARKVSYLIRKTLREVNSKDYPQNQIKFMCENHSSKRIVEKASNRLMYVAVEGERILGTVGLKDTFITTLFVNPKFHNRGIGTELMNHVESTARKKGYICVSVPSSVTAYDFYRKRGYKKVRDEYSPQYGQVIVMEKKL